MSGNSKTDSPSRQTVPVVPFRSWTWRLLLCNFAAVIGTSFITGFAIHTFVLVSSFLPTNGYGSKERRSSIGILTNVGTRPIIAFYTAKLVALVGPAALLAELIGRKRSLLIGAVIGVIAFSLAIVSFHTGSSVGGNLNFLIAACAMLGIQSGIGLVVAPAYLVEVAPDSARGFCGALYEIFYWVGVALSFVREFDFEISQRIQLTTQAVGAILILAIHSVLLLFAEESPRWLLQKKRQQVAVEALMKLRKCSLEEADAQLEAIKASTPDRNWQCFCGCFKQLIRLIWPLFIGLSLTAANYLTGASMIYQMQTATVQYMWRWRQGDDKFNFIFQIAFIILCPVVMAASALLVDRIGRRPLVVIGLTIMTLASIPIFVGFYFQFEFPMCRMIGFFVFMVGHAIGPGPIGAFMVAEIFDQRTRLFAVSFCHLVTQMVPVVWFDLWEYTIPGHLMIPLPIAVCVLETVLLFFFLPETKQISVEQAAAKCHRPGNQCCIKRSNTNDAAIEAPDEIISTRETKRISSMDNEAVTIAAFKLSWEIAKEGKPYSEGEFFKKSLLKIVPSLFAGMENKKRITERIELLPVSCDIVTKCVEALSGHVLASTTSAIQAAEAWSVALFVVAGCRGHAKKVAIWVKTSSSSSSVSTRFLALFKKEDNFFEAFVNLTKKHNLPMSKLVSAWTDDSDTLLQFMTSLKILHRHIQIYPGLLVHRKSHFGSSIYLDAVFMDVIRIVNSIGMKVGQPPRAITLEDLGEDCSSRGQVLDHFLASLPELRQSRDFPEVSRPEWVARVAFLCDVTALLNDFIEKLHVKDNKLPDFVKVVTAFRLKLQLLIDSLTSNPVDWSHFEKLIKTNYLKEAEASKTAFLYRLDGIKAEFDNKHQSSFDQLRSYCTFMTSPMQVSREKRLEIGNSLGVSTRQLDDEALNLTATSDVDSNVQLAGLPLSKLATYERPAFRECWVKLSTFFGTAYQFDETFSTITRIYRSDLSEDSLETLVRCALTEESPDFRKLAQERPSLFIAT